jgi:hypothetical protein
VPHHGAARARLIHFVPYSQTYSIPFLKRQCDRTLGAARRRRPLAGRRGRAHRFLGLAAAAAQAAVAAPLVRDPGPRAGVRPPARRRGGQRERGGARARSHCRFVPPLIRFTLGSRTCSVPLIMKRQCDRTLGGAAKQVDRPGRLHRCRAQPRPRGARARGAGAELRRRRATRCRQPWTPKSLRHHPVSFIRDSLCKIYRAALA